jgi:hypothetical protein
MQTVIAALIGAALGVLAVWLGLRFHIGSWFFDGITGYAGAAIGGAFVAIVVRYALSRTFGWP